MRTSIFFVFFSCSNQASFTVWRNSEVSKKIAKKWEINESKIQEEEKQQKRLTYGNVICLNKKKSNFTIVFFIDLVHINKLLAIYLFYLNLTGPIFFLFFSSFRFLFMVDRFSFRSFIYLESMLPWFSKSCIHNSFLFYIFDELHSFFKL